MENTTRATVRGHIVEAREISDQPNWFHFVWHKSSHSQRHFVGVCLGERKMKTTQHAEDYCKQLAAVLCGLNPS